jgi:peptide/nickel transport system substrate-binding protein
MNRGKITGTNPTRRQLLGGLAATGLAATGLTGAWPGSHPRPALASQPQQGGHLRVGLSRGSTTDSLDPATYANSFTDTLGPTINGTLTEIDAHGQVIPELAEKWDVSADAKRWVFTIRKEVEFHNGKTLTPADVVASINHHRGAKSTSAVKPFADVIEAIDIDGDKVVFTLIDGNADFPCIIGDYHFAILPATEGKIDWQSGVSSGAYKIGKFQPGNRADLTRHTNYWKQDRAHFADVSLLVIHDQMTRMNALLSGEIDVMENVDPNTAPLFQGNSGLKVEVVKGGLHGTLPMRADTAPFTDVNIRLALKYAIDRDDLIKRLRPGMGTVANDHPIAPSYRYFAASVTQRGYDLDKAKFHLKKAGLTTLKLDLSISDEAFQGAVDLAQIYREHAAKAGIDITVVREPADGYWDNVWMKKPWCGSYWGSRPTEDMILSSAYQSTAPWNESFWKNDRFDNLLRSARPELDESKRAEIYAEAQQILRDEGSVVIPMFSDFVFATSSKIAHGDLAHNSDLDGRRLGERWWFA